MPTCGARQSITEEGTCQDCGEFTVVAADSRSCKRPTCAARQKILADGTCETCEAYTIVDPAGTACVAPVCAAKEIIKTDGSCEAPAPVPSPSFPGAGTFTGGGSSNEGESSTETGPVAPRSPETDRKYECKDETTLRAENSFDIAESSLARAEATYTAAKEDLKAAENTNKERQLQVDSIASELAMSRLLLETAQAQSATLAARFDAANTDVLLCSSNPDSCTVAEKGIKVRVSGKASDAMLANDADIAKHERDIETYTASFATKSAQLDAIKAST